MILQNGLITSESVSDGHPDKLADRISDAVLDAFLELEPTAHVSCQTFLHNETVVVAGEFKTRSTSTFEAIRERTVGIVADILRGTGYQNADTGIDPDACRIEVDFSHQSPDIDLGVTQGYGVIGAGDQGMMIGYACKETPALMPAPVIYAHQLMRRQAELRQSGQFPWLQPDGKSQVSFRYEAGTPVAIETVVLSTQHSAEIDIEELRKLVSEEIIASVIPPELRSHHYRELINPTGRFVIGGPKGDTGLTGRKIIVDTYGGVVPHGGGSFSGKDPSKVDRSASYMARYLAKQIVARSWAGRALIQLAYAIGVAEPVSLMVQTDQNNPGRDAEIEAALQTEFDLTPAGIIEHLKLQRPIYRPTAAFGHFGRTDLDLSWEHIKA